MGTIDEVHDPYAAADARFLRTTTRPDYASGEREVRVADLFCGAGAMSLGLAEACRALGFAFQPVLACDIDDAALGVYAANLGILKPPTRDLAGISSLLEASSTPFEVGLAKSIGELDVVIAGPPCQGHSNLNNHTRRDDPKNALYFRMARFAKLFEPKFMIIENVPTVVRDKGAVVHRTRDALERLGYRVRTGIVDMARIGVAQSRRRHVLLAFHATIPFRIPEIAEIVHGYAVPQRDVMWAIGDLEAVEKSGDLFDAPGQMSERTIKRIDWLFENGKYELDNEERPDCHRTKDHKYNSVYGRMRPERPAPTITSGFNSMGQGRFVHPTRKRTITPHEAARLQFIPDFFDFSSVPHKNALTAIIGNAVPPKLSYVVGLEILR